MVILSKIITQSDGKSYNFLRTLVYLTCIERMELDAFPFDVQELTVVMDMRFVPVERAMFVPDRTTSPKPNNSHSVVVSSEYDEDDTSDPPSLILNRQYCTFPDFDAKRVVVQFASAVYDAERELDENAFRWGQVTIRFQLVRQHSRYLYRVGFYNFVLSVTSVCAFALSPIDDLGDRIGFLITLILAAVAFQYIVSQYIPNVPYLTVLDKYTFGVFSVACLLLTAVSLISVVKVSDDMRNELDKWFCQVYVVLLVLMQLSFLVYGYRVRARSMEKLRMGSMDLKDINFVEEKDSAINVGGTKAVFLPESKKPME